MINKIIENRLYIGSSLLLCSLTYLLNCCTAIYQCALIFTIIVITINTTTAICGRFKSLIGLVIAIVISFVLLWKIPYYIDGHIVNGLVLASFLSLMISLYWSTFALKRFYSQFSFVVSNALSLIIAALIDGLIMTLFFVFNNNFTYSRILDIFSRELSYKIFYGFLASIIIFAAFKIFKVTNNPNYKLK